MKAFRCFRLVRVVNVNHIYESGLTDFGNLCLFCIFIRALLYIIANSKGSCKQTNRSSNFVLLLQSICILRYFEKKNNNNNLRLS